MPPRTQQALRAQIADLRPAGEAGHKLMARIAPKGDARGRLMASLSHQQRGRPPDARISHQQRGAAVREPLASSTGASA